LARTSFQFAKRQKELERKKKMEEKRQRKLEKKAASSATAADGTQPAPEEGNQKSAADRKEDEGNP
jgi:uncharacterized protein (DUF2336 family)